MLHYCVQQQLINGDYQLFGITFNKIGKLYPFIRITISPIEMGDDNGRGNKIIFVKRFFG